MMRVFRHGYALAVLLLAMVFVVAACTASPGAQPGTGASPTTASDAEPTVAATEASPTEAPTEAAVEATPEVTATVEMTATLETTETPTVEATPAVTATNTVTATGAMTGTGATAVNAVIFTAQEYSFDAPASLPAGWTRVTQDNQGQQPHDLNLFKLEAGKTITDVMTALQSEGPPDWVQMYGSVGAAPGESHSYVVNLDAGSYVGLSFGQNQQGPPDAAQGMLHLFEVTGESAALSADALPQADVTVDMLDYTFVITGTLQSGEQTLHVLNTGQEPHEMQVFRLNEGVTFEQFRSMLDQEPQAGAEPPFTFINGPVISPGVEVYVTMNLEPGTHVIVCFIPSAKNGGQPHYMLGMIREVQIQ